MKTTLCYVFTTNDFTLAEFQISVHSFAEHNKFDTDINVYTDHPILVKCITEKIKYDHITFHIHGLLSIPLPLSQLNLNDEFVDYSLSYMDEDHKQSSMTYLEYIEIVACKVLALIECLKNYDFVIMQDIDTLYLKSISDTIISLNNSSYGICGLENEAPSKFNPNETVPCCDVGCMIFEREKLKDIDLLSEFNQFLMNYDPSSCNNFDELFIGKLINDISILHNYHINFNNDNWCDEYENMNKIICVHFHNSIFTRRYDGKNRIWLSTTIFLLFDKYIESSTKYGISTHHLDFSTFVSKHIVHNCKDINKLFNDFIPDDVKEKSLYKEKLLWWMRFLLR
jgi:hypothetical protein